MGLAQELTDCRMEAWEGIFPYVILAGILGSFCLLLQHGAVDLLLGSSGCISLNQPPAIAGASGIGAPRSVLFSGGGVDLLRAVMLWYDSGGWAGCGGAGGL